MNNPKSIFISYSWDSDEHRLWVKQLADLIEENPEYHVIWDGYDLDNLIDKNLYMEKSVIDADYMVIVATKKYQEKSNARTGGVGIETSIAVSQYWEQMQNGGKSKIFSILREKDAIPTYLKNQLHIDFTDESNFEIKFNDLLNVFKDNTLFKRPAKKKVILDT